jgi:hypothetical protein
MSNLDETVSNVSNFAYISWRIFMGGGWEKFGEDESTITYCGAG